MPARIIGSEDILPSPDLTTVPGELDPIAFQDCMTIVSAFERLSHFSSTEESVYAPVSHMVQGTKYWAKSAQEILQSRLPKTNIITDTAGQVEIRSESPDNTVEALLRSRNFNEALEVLKDDCIPCDLRIKLALENLQTDSLIEIYLADIRERIRMLTQIDKLLGDIEIFRDICGLLEILNFMCVPDLQRMIAILMASMMKVNVNLSDLNGLIVSLILPIIQPILSGVVNMQQQFSILVTEPTECILDSILEQLNKINVGGLAQEQIDQLTALRDQANIEAAGEAAVSAGLEELYRTILDGRNYLQTKLDFYTTALEKALTDYTGDSQNYMRLAAQKMKILQLIKLIISIIELRKKGRKLCEPGITPSQRELDDFFRNFLNPNSFVQVTIDQDGVIRVEEPGEVLYQIEETGEGAKILNYKPEGLLTTPVAMEFKCSFHTNASDVEKLNKYIQDLNRLSE